MLGYIIHIYMTSASLPVAVALLRRGCGMLDLGARREPQRRSSGLASPSLRDYPFQVRYYACI